MHLKIQNEGKDHIALLLKADSNTGVDAHYRKQIFTLFGWEVKSDRFIERFINGRIIT